MSYVALYRRWRPQNFASLVGQQPVKTALSNALTSGRIAHAYLFAGPRGTGKTSTARILAKALNCADGPTAEPCGSCKNCMRITDGTSMDVFEIDAASNRGIDEIKNLREQLAFTPVDCRYKIYIIDEVHMLTTEAFNALLKTLEEPPSHVIFILATTDPHKIPATIHSRCQRFDFRRVTVDETVEHLKMIADASGIRTEPEALRMIAVQAEGGMRDALSLFDQCGVMSDAITVKAVKDILGIVGQEMMRELAGDIGNGDLVACLQKLNLLLEQGKDVRQFLTELAEYLRALLLYKAVPSYEEIYLIDTAEALAASAEKFSQARLLAAEERIHAAILELRTTMRPRITAELCLVELCKQEGSTLAALAARVEQLEAKLGGDSAKSKLSSRPRMEDIPSSRMIKIPEKVAPLAEKNPLSEIPEKKVLVKTSAREETYENVSAESDIAAPDTHGEGSAYWKQVLELLASEKKLAMVSCAKQGVVTSFSGGVLTLAFKVKFQRDRMNKEDFRSAFEDALLRVVRQPIKLECVLSGTAEKDVSAGARQTAKKNLQSDKLEELPGNARRALDILGGSISKIEN